MEKKLLAIFIFFIFPIFTALVLGEIFVRIFSKTGYITPEILRKMSLQYERGVFARNVFPKFEQKTKGENNADIYINSKGYRGRDFEAIKHKGKIRIMFYGGSSVFDIAVSEGKDWPHLVEKKLQEAGFKQVEVINAGTPSNNSFESLGRLMFEGHFFQPDYVVLSNEWNDIKYFRFDEPLLRQWNAIPNIVDPLLNYQNPIDQFLSEHSQAYVRLRTRYFLWKYKVTDEGAEAEGDYTDYLSDNALKQYKLNLEVFVDLVRDIEAIPILMTESRLVAEKNNDDQNLRIKYRSVKLNHNALYKAFREADEIIRQVGKSKNVLVIDTGSKFEGQDDLFKDQVHTTEKGSKEIANIVAASFVNILRLRK